LIQGEAADQVNDLLAPLAFALDLSAQPPGQTRAGKRNPRGRDFD
jgi:hypothetical protein